MASIFRRMFKVAESNAHAAMDNLEDPIKMTEQGIRDLKKNLQAAMVSLAEVKSLAIRMQKEASDHKKRSADYERKAMLLLKKMEAGEMDAGEAERLATAALEQKEAALQQAATATADHQTQQRMADQLQGKVEDLKRQIGTHENEAITLKARARTASSMRKINQQLAGADASGTVAMLEKMKQKGRGVARGGLPAALRRRRSRRGGPSPRLRAAPAPIRWRRRRRGARAGLKRFSDSPCTAWARRGTSACTNAGGPMQAYSMDLRERALLDSDAGMKAADVAVKYRVSGSWVRLLTRTTPSSQDI